MKFQYNFSIQASRSLQGVLGTDMELAGSLWRSFFAGDKDIDPVDLENMVCYVRKQVN